MIHRNTLNCRRFVGNYPARSTRVETHKGLLLTEPQEMALVTGHGRNEVIQHLYRSNSSSFAFTLLKKGAHTRDW